jgi:hypothetical protein
MDIKRLLIVWCALVAGFHALWFWMFQSMIPTPKYFMDPQLFVVCANLFFIVILFALNRPLAVVLAVAGITYPFAALYLSGFDVSKIGDSRNLTYSMFFISKGLLVFYVSFLRLWTDSQDT